MTNWKGSIRKEEKQLNSTIAYYMKLIDNLITQIGNSPNFSQMEIRAELEVISEEMSKELYS